MAPVESLASRLRAALATGRPLVGTLVKLASPAVAEILGVAGFDFVVVDFEHGGLGYDLAEDIARAADAGGCALLVRLSGAGAAEIGHALELGAAGLHCPHIESAAEMEQILRAIHLPPRGERGFSLSNRAARFGRVPGALYYSAAWRPVLVPQIESLAAIQALPAIAAVNGVDLVFLGRGDLSAALGTPGEIGDARVWEAVAEAAAQAERAGIPWGAFAGGIEDGRRLLQMGCRYLVVETDVTLLRGMAEQVVRGLRPA
ncbi:MAG: aldolase/citrate lyase family protein [Ardenticatenaceae bacterium]|nr:aldolase/citrate lyase family protein [Ardenticatenaceae bacterium]